MNNNDLDDFIKAQAQEAERDFKGKLTKILDDWQEKSTDMLASMNELQMQFMEDTGTLNTQFSNQIEAIKEVVKDQNRQMSNTADTIVGVVETYQEQLSAFNQILKKNLDEVLSGLEQQSQHDNIIKTQLNDISSRQNEQLRQVNLSQEKAIEILNFVLRYGEQSDAFNQNLNKSMEELSSNLEKQSQFDQKAEAILNDIAANQSKHYNLVQLLQEKLTVIAKAVDQANLKSQEVESSILNVSQMLSTEIQNFKSALMPEIATANELVNKKLNNIQWRTLLALIAILIILSIVVVSKI